MDTALFADDATVARPDPVETASPWRVLVVDDEPNIHAVTRLVLEGVTFQDRPVELLSALGGAEARDILSSGEPVAVVILDVVMETDDAGLRLVHWMRRTRGLTDPRIVIRTGQPGQAPQRKVILDYDINDYRTKTELTSEHLFSAVIGALRSFADLTALRETCGLLDRTHTATVHALADLAEFRDTDTADHVCRVQSLTERTALALGLSRREATAVGLAAVLHDLGKVAVPDAILRKPGKLTADEWQAMKGHSAHGSDALRRAVAAVGEQGYLALAADVARHHHERYDGTGYPDGLSGKAIPLAARIASVADVFDALTSDRPYKMAWPVDRALDEMRASRGTHFDPDVLDAFLSILPPVLPRTTAPTTAEATP